VQVLLGDIGNYRDINMGEGSFRPADARPG